jgi:hypothetical protein
MYNVNLFRIVTLNPPVQRYILIKTVQNFKKNGSMILTSKVSLLEVSKTMQSGVVQEIISVLK